MPMAIQGRRQGGERRASEVEDARSEREPAVHEYQVRDGLVTTAADELSSSSAPTFLRACSILRDLIGRGLGAVRHVRDVRKIGSGMSRNLVAAEVELEDGRVGSYVVALPRP